MVLVLLETFRCPRMFSGTWLILLYRIRSFRVLKTLCVCVWFVYVWAVAAVGCLDLGDDQLPPGTWMDRSKHDKHLALVRCAGAPESSQESWRVTCQHGVWSLDNVGNCTTTTRRQVEGLRHYY